MKEKVRLVKTWVAMLLPIIIFFSLLSVSYAQTNTDITASVSTLPGAKIECKPDILSAGSDVEWINCFIELEGANAQNIDFQSLTLAVDGLNSSLSPDPSFKVFNDFDDDGELDLQIRFNRTIADSLWFSHFNLPQTFTLVLTGSVQNFPFSGSDTIQIISPCSTEKAKYTQMGLLKADKPTKGNLNVIGNIDLSLYSQDFSHFSGFFLCKDRLIGNAAFYTTGDLNVPKTANFFRIPIHYLDKQPVRISVLFKEFDDCVANSGIVHCSGSGKLIVWNEGTREWEGFDLKTLRFDIVNGKAKIEGGDFWNDIFSVENIQMGRITVK